MSYRPCATCIVWRIRVFMLIGMFLMLAMFVQPQGIVGLASKMPSPMMIGLGIVILGTVMGIVRYRQSVNESEDDLV